jgi:ADP-heptose:LPS heptosyltransferase
MLGLPSPPLPSSVQTGLDEFRRGGQAVIVVAIGSGKDVTMWPLRYYSALVGMLLSASPCAVYLVGSSQERADAEQIVADNQSPPSLVNLCGATSVTQLTTLLKSTDLFLGNSTGTAHLAAMSGAPTLTLHSGTNDPAQWGPIGAKTVCMSLDVPCRRCHIIDLSQCAHGYRCMVELTPEIVFQQVSAMLLDAPARLQVTYPSKVNA